MLTINFTGQRLDIDLPKTSECNPLCWLDVRTHKTHHHNCWNYYYHLDTVRKSITAQIHKPTEECNLVSYKEARAMVLTKRFEPLIQALMEPDYGYKSIGQGQLYDLSTIPLPWYILRRKRKHGFTSLYYHLDFMLDELCKGEDPKRFRYHAHTPKRHWDRIYRYICWLLPISHQKYWGVGNEAETHRSYCLFYLPDQPL